MPAEDQGGLRSRLAWDVGLAIVSVLMAAAGVLTVLGGHTATSRWAGAGGALIFGLVAARPMARLLDPQRSRLGPYLPLAAVVAEIPWVMAMMLSLLLMIGDEPVGPSDTAEQWFGLLGGVPAAAGIVTGVIAIVGRWARGAIEWCCLVAGSLACAAIASALAAGVLG